MHATCGVCVDGGMLVKGSEYLTQRKSMKSCAEMFDPRSKSVQHQHSSYHLPILKNNLVIHDPLLKCVIQEAGWYSITLIYLD